MPNEVNEVDIFRPSYNTVGVGVGADVPRIGCWAESVF